MGEPIYRRLNIKLRIKRDNTVEKEQLSEYEATISLVEDGDDKVLTITALIEENRHGSL